MIPWFCTIRWGGASGHRPHRLWLPLFLLWPLVLLLFLIGEAVMLAVGVVMLFSRPQNAVRCIMVLPILWNLLAGFSGLCLEVINVKDGLFFIELK